MIVFAIVDIETCGSRFSFQKGRIIEICILVHDGLQVVDKFSTLIHPECSISGFYSNISGITNDMVEGAPRFYEVAKDILHYTEGKIFVAHNVGFDYHFIQDEFASLGYKFKRDTLCTVKMSRKLLPGKKSYSLGNLCESLGIEIENRHRAEGDAVATAKVLDILLQLKSQNPAFKTKSLYQLMTTRTEAIKKYVLDKLPDSCGVYYFLNQAHEIIYVGKSVNMYTRALSHYNSDIQKTKKMLYELHSVDHIETGSELISLLLEAIEIKKHQPQFNKKSKAALYTHGITFFRNEEGVLCLELKPYDEQTLFLAAFTHHSTAREKLDEWIDEYRLCFTYCGLGEVQPCFAYQIQKCYGICVKKEEVEEYNLRMNVLIQRYSYDDEEFMIVERGRHADEFAFVWIKNYQYKGYGYVDKDVAISSGNDLIPYLESSVYYPDSDALIRSYLRQKTPKVVKF